MRVDIRRGAETCVAKLGLRRFEWFAHIAKQRRMRMTEVMPAKTTELRLRASRKQVPLMQISGSQIRSVASGEDE